MVRIGVIGQSGILPDEVLNMAAKIGKSIAAAGAVVLTGGTNGVMEAVSRGAKEAGGLVVGILPGTDATVANPYVDIPITTGMGFDYRSMVLIHSSDAVIMVSGGIGTLVELSAAYMRQKPVVVLETSGGWANRVKELAYDGIHLDQRREHYPLHLDFATDPEAAVAMALARIQGRAQAESSSQTQTRLQSQSQSQSFGKTTSAGNRAEKIDNDNR